MKDGIYRINTNLVKDMTVGRVISIGNGIVERHGVGVTQEIELAALYVRNDLVRFKFTPKGFDIKVEDFYRMVRMVSEDFIQIHRLNYLTYQKVQEFADELEAKGQLKNNLKKCWKDIEGMFDKYQKAYRGVSDSHVWATVQDHLNLVCNLVQPHIEPLENAVRDYLIQHREDIVRSCQRDDITLLTKVYVILMFCAALRNTRLNFFRNILVEKGFDLSCDFRYADIDGVGRMFVHMMGFMGVRFTKDKDGDAVPVGVDMSKSVRVEGAWNAIVRIVTNDQLMDEKAIEAINMNPDTKADYEARMAKIEQKELDAAIGELGQKFNVTGL